MDNLRFGYYKGEAIFLINSYFDLKFYEVGIQRDIIIIVQNNQVIAEIKGDELSMKIKEDGNRD